MTTRNLNKQKPKQQQQQKTTQKTNPKLPGLIACGTHVKVKIDPEEFHLMTNNSLV